MDHFAINSQIRMHDVGDQPIDVYADDLAVETLEGEIIECRLTVRVTPELYQRIDREAIFNLKPQVRKRAQVRRFAIGRDVEIELRLDDDMLVPLSTRASSAEDAAAHLVEQSRRESDNPLLETERWYALYVKQEVPLPPDLEGTGVLKLGYSTTWADRSTSAKGRKDQQSL